MLIDSGLADTQATGNLLEGDTVAEVLQDDVAADRRFQETDSIVQDFQFFIKPVWQEDSGFKVKEVESLHPFLYLSATDYIQTSVPYACKQIGLGSLFPETIRIVEQLKK